MTLVMLVILGAAALGVGIWAYATAIGASDHADRADAPRQQVTSTDHRPPPHPAEPVPGSDTARHQHGAP